VNLFENIQRIQEMMDLDSSSKYYVDKSELGGEGVFAKKRLSNGEVIGLLHTIIKLHHEYDFTELGKKHNHKDNPNCHNELIDNQRFLVASRDINKGEELTTNYRLQPDLEQPESWYNGLNEKKYEPHIDGYRTYSPFKQMDYIVVHSNGIDCDNIVWDLVLVGNKGEIKYCKKNSGSVFFDKSNVVIELPLKNNEDFDELTTNDVKLKKWVKTKLNKFKPKIK
jgi:SET domain-containing protein